MTNYELMQKRLENSKRKKEMYRNDPDLFLLWSEVVSCTEEIIALMPTKYAGAERYGTEDTGA